MQALLIISVLLFLNIRSLYGEPATFEEFKQLPRSEQDTLFNDNLHPPSPTLRRWRQRLGMSDLAWQHTQEEQLGQYNGFGALETFILDYQHLIETYLPQHYARNKAIAKSADEQATVLAHYREAAKSANTLYNDVRPLVAALKRNEMSLALNKKARGIDVRWKKRWPDGKEVVITDNEMAAINKDAKGILDQLNKLPKMTPKEERAAFDALPPED